jgi:Ca-activated chloride channel family protein
MFVLVLSMQVIAANKLTVQDPLQNWRYDSGSLEEAILTLKPCGAFIEYSMIMTFSSRSTAMTNPRDTLEVQYFFDLPENSHMVDAWLWVEDTIMQARLLEKGQATLIYEGIVKRRRDPLILFKQSQTSYEMRIFPMAGNQTRTAKITWITPLKWNESSAYSMLPLGLISCAKNKPAETAVFIYKDAIWKNVRITDNKNLSLTDEDWFELGNCKGLAINPNQLTQNCTIAWDSPALNGVFLSAFEEKANEGYYSMVLMPSKALSFAASKKILFLVDYDAAKTDLSRQELINNIRSAIISFLTARDSFNIIFARNDAKPVSAKWIPGNPDEVNALFDNLPQNILSYYSVFSGLLIKGAEFVKAQGHECSLFIIANSDAFGSNKSANPLIEEFNATIGALVQINIVDYSTKYRMVYTMNNKNYSGNEYLYSYLSIASGGTYLDILKHNSNFTQVITEGFKTLDGQINSFEIYPSATNGFCYGRYLLSGSNNNYSTQPVVQLGKWVGELPLSITATGFYRNNAFSKKIDLNENDINWTNSRTKQSWVGTYIKSLETGTKTNDIVAEIITTSIKERVLSLYTAFLALEPERQQQEDEKDDKQTSAEDMAISEFVSISSFPNPFTDKITFSIKLSGPNTELLNVEIYNMLGEKVANPLIENYGEKITVVWDGCDSSNLKLAQGFYIARFLTNRGVIHIKVIIK